ncbi:MAG: metalloprotease [Candidatus Nanohaloarchaea archaeon]
MKFEEKRDLLLAWLILGVAFANLLGGLNFNSILVALLTAGLGFLLHELAHKVVAQQYGLNAEFIADYQMLAIALFASFAGFIFAAPGAVYTAGQRTREQQLWITSAGPITNIVLGIIFLMVPGQIGSYGSMINVWLALFNLIPFGNIDGKKILDASKPVYIALVAISVILFLL